MFSHWSLAVVALLLSEGVFTTAHQSISYPTPISTMNSCRVGFTQNCPGPCPNNRLRQGQTPKSPSVTVRRGDVLTVHTKKNNHVAGFSRWSLVKVRDLQNKKKHAENAFLYTCADSNLSKCTSANKYRDCPVDQMNQYYRHFISIPTIYADDVYVLGWVWYGGAVRHGRTGNFGDYYDCVYIRVRGGPKSDFHKPTFNPKSSFTGRDGHCLATTDRIGVCWREPCPGGNRRTSFLVPWEFKGKEPRPISAKNFAPGKEFRAKGKRSHGKQKKPRDKKARSPDKRKVSRRGDKSNRDKKRSPGDKNNIYRGGKGSREDRTPTVKDSKPKKGSPQFRSITIQSLKLRHADYPNAMILADSKNGFYFYHRGMHSSLRFTFTCDVSGDVRNVAFYINNKRVRTDYTSPYSASSKYEFFLGGRMVERYTPYVLGIGQWVLVLECQAIGVNGSESWKRIEFRTYV